MYINTSLKHIGKMNTSIDSNTGIEVSHVNNTIQTNT